MKKFFGLEDKKRKLIERKEWKKSLLKGILRNSRLKKEWRWKGFIQLNSNFFKKGRVNLVNRSIKAGRSKSVVKGFRLNRLEVLEGLKKEEIPGYRSLSSK